IGRRLLTERLREAFGAMLGAVIAELSPREFAEIGQGLLQATGIVIGVKGDQMHVRRHDDKCVDPKVLVPMAERQTVGDDLARCLGSKHGKPFDDGISQVVDSDVGVDAIAFHSANGNRLGPRKSKRIRAKMATAMFLAGEEEETFGRSGGTVGDRATTAKSKR